MAPVAGSAYTYAYTTLGEIFAWIIGWDLILEYAMGCATVASAWSNYLNEFLLAISNDYLQIPKQLLYDPFTHVEGLAGRPWFNLPSVCITLAIMAILILGIRESARTNAVLVGIKVSVVLLVIGVGCAYIQPANWTSIPYAERSLPEEFAMRDLAENICWNRVTATKPSAEQVDGLTKQLKAEYRIGWIKQETRTVAEGRPDLRGRSAEHGGQDDCQGRAEPAPDRGRSPGRRRQLLPDVRENGQSQRSPNPGASWACWESTAGCCPSTTPCAVRSCPTACRASCWGRRSCSSPTSASTRSRPTPRKPEPGARRAHRHPRLPGGVHRALHGRGRGDHRHGALSEHRHPRADRRGLRRQGG